MYLNITKILENNQTSVQSNLNLDDDYFTDLSKGQFPEIICVGCSDSRVISGKFMGAAAGNVFVHRNIANLVPPCKLSSMSVIDYMGLYLKVTHVVLCGLYYCGGIKAAIQSEDQGILNYG